jgi:hypothetical protein
LPFKIICNVKCFKAYAYNAGSSLMIVAESDPPIPRQIYAINAVMREAFEHQFQRFCEARELAASAKSASPPVETPCTLPQPPIAEVEEGGVTKVEPPSETLCQPAEDKPEPGTEPTSLSVDASAAMQGQEMGDPPVSTPSPDPQSQPPVSQLAQSCSAGELCPAVAQPRIARANARRRLLVKLESIEVVPPRSRWVDTGLVP